MSARRYVLSSAAVGGDSGDVDGMCVKQEPMLSPRQCVAGAATSPGCGHQTAQESDEDDPDPDPDSDPRPAGQSPSYKQRRREAHTFAEQKRRDAIKRGYDMLQELVPACHAQEGGVATASTAYKMSKAAVLQKSIEYMEHLLKQKRRQEEELVDLRKELVTLKIVKANYEKVVKDHQSRPIQQASQVPDEVKFQVFRAIMDNVFLSFENSVSTNSFAELSGSLIAWMEEDMKPQVLRDTCLQVLRQLEPSL